MKASVEEYNSEHGYGSENVDLWTIFQGLSQNEFRAAHLAPEVEGFLSDTIDRDSILSGEQTILLAGHN